MPCTVPVAVLNPQDLDSQGTAMVSKAGGDTQYQLTWTVGFASEPNCAGAHRGQSRGTLTSSIVLQEAGGPRSPTVFGAIVSYVEQFFDTVGISLANQQVHPSQMLCSETADLLHAGHSPLESVTEGD